MRTLVAISLLLIAEALAGEHGFVSPNGELEAYTMPANEDGSGMKLFLHRANSRDAGALLRQNNRWIDAKWSPDSRFLAVIDHLDGHIAMSTSSASALTTRPRHFSITRQSCTHTMCGGTFRAGMHFAARSC